MLFHGFRQIQCVGRRTCQTCDLQVLEKTQMLFRIAGGCRDYSGSHVLHAVVRSEPAREQSVAVADGKDVLTCDPVSRESPGCAFTPYLQVSACVTHYRRIPGSPGRSVEPDYFRLAGSLETRRIVVPEVLLGGKRQFPDVFYRPDIIGCHVQCLHLFPVERHVVVDQFHEFVKPFPLQIGHFVPAHAFFILVPDHGFIVCWFFIMFFCGSWTGPGWNPVICRPDGPF